MSKSRASSCSASEGEAASRTIVLSANSDWNIANFRGGLIRGLRAAGYEPMVIAPQDPAADSADARDWTWSAFRSTSIVRASIRSPT